MTKNMGQGKRLQKLLKNMNENDRKHLLLAAQQTTIHDKLMTDTTARLVLAGREATYIYLYEKYARAIVANNEDNSMTENDLYDTVKGLLTEICDRYIQIMAQREGAKHEV